MSSNTVYDLKELFEDQMIFQQLLGFTVPEDDPEMLAHHAIGLITEVGEVMQADKRWKKNKRNDHYDKQEKIDELADVIIYLINMCLYSKVATDTFYKAVARKIKLNKERYLKEDQK